MIVALVTAPVHSEVDIDLPTGIGSPTHGSYTRIVGPLDEVLVVDRLDGAEEIQSLPQIILAKVNFSVMRNDRIRLKIVLASLGVALPTVRTTSKTCSLPLSSRVRTCCW